MSFLPALITFILGALIAYMNYRITKKLYLTKPDKALSFIFGRQLINFAYLTAVFFIGRKFLSNINPALVGAAVGLTVPALLFTLSLSKELKTDSENPDEGGDKK